jgi:uncharacterized integral membrane protein
MGNYVKSIFLIIILLVLVTFGIKNSETLKLHYYFDLHSIDFPIYGLVYASVLLGVIIGMLVGIRTNFSRRKKIKALEKENKALKAKIEEADETLTSPIPAEAEEKTEDKETDVKPE